MSVWLVGYWEDVLAVYDNDLEAGKHYSYLRHSTVGDSGPWVSEIEVRKKFSKPKPRKRKKKS